MLKHLFIKDGTIAVAIAAISSVALTGCVDNDYDLSKDLDLNVTVGGNLYLPTSSTGLLTMGNVLDLDANSSIKAITQEDIANGTNYGLSLGDYVLTQTADPTYTSVKVDQVNLKNVDCTDTDFNLEFPLAIAGEITLPTDFHSDMNVPDQTVEESIKQLYNAETDLDLHVNVDYSSDEYDGDFTVKAGYLVTFNEAWTISIPSTSETARFAEVVDGNRLRFTTDKTFSKGHPFVLDIKIININFRNLPEGEGVYKPGHFKLNSKIDFLGDVSIENATARPTIAKVVMHTNTTIPQATLLGITGVVDPEITINDTRVEINDIPDFLTNDGNNLDIANPQIYFTVANTSPVEVSIIATLAAAYNNGTAPVEIKIGEQTDGTAPIKIAPNSVTKICLSRTGESNDASVTSNIEVSRLSELLTKIPDIITITDIEAQVAQTPVTFKLSDPDDRFDRGYEFNATYEAVVPLSFGKNMTLVYDDSDSGWDEDLEKYNFNEVVVTMDVVNTVPLKLVPDAYLINDRGEKFTDVVVTIDGEVAAGSIAAPSTSPLSISIKSVGKNLDGVNGVQYAFTAKSGQNTTGVVLNEQQTLRFDNIKVAIKGGITVDLND